MYRSSHVSRLLVHKPCLQLLAVTCYAMPPYCCCQSTSSYEHRHHKTIDTHHILTQAVLLQSFLPIYRTAILQLPQTCSCMPPSAALLALCPKQKGGTMAYIPVVSAGAFLLQLMFLMTLLACSFQDPACVSAGTLLFTAWYAHSSSPRLLFPRPPLTGLEPPQPQRKLP